MTLYPKFFGFFYHLNALNRRITFKHLEYFGGKGHVVQCQAVVVVDDALLVGSASGVVAGKHLANFVVGAELTEIFEPLHMVGVVRHSTGRNDDRSVYLDRKSVV